LAFEEAPNAHKFLEGWPEVFLSTTGVSMAVSRVSAMAPCASSNGIVQLIEDFGTAIFKIQKKNTPHQDKANRSHKRHLANFIRFGTISKSLVQATCPTAKLLAGSSRKTSRAGIVGLSHRPIVAAEDDDLPAMVWCRVGPGLRRQHREDIANVWRGSPQACDTEPRRAVQGEQPLVLFRTPLGPFGRRELIEAVRDNQAPPAAKLPPLRPKVVNRLAAWTWPAPPHHQQPRQVLTLNSISPWRPPKRSQNGFMAMAAPPHVQIEPSRREFHRMVL
jgi:hypothetical protein